MCPIVVLPELQTMTDSLKKNLQIALKASEKLQNVPAICVASPPATLVSRYIPKYWVPNRICSEKSLRAYGIKLIYFYFKI